MTLRITTYFTAGQGHDCYSRYRTHKRQGNGTRTSQGRSRYSSPRVASTAHRRS